MGGAEGCGPERPPSNSIRLPLFNPHNACLSCVLGHVYALTENAKLYLPLGDLQIPGAPEGALSISQGSSREAEPVGGRD